MAVRGNKVGTFKDQSFYLLPNGRCRHGSTGRIQLLADFCRELGEGDRRALLTLIEGTMGQVVEATVIGAEVKGPDTQTEIAVVPAGELYSSPDFRLYPDGKVHKNGQDMTLAQYLGTLPKGQVRKVRQLCRSLGMLGLAATKREKV